MTKTGLAPERQRINPNEDYELRYWSERFDVPTDEIVAAVKRVGTRVEDVARELNRHAYSEATIMPRVRRMPKCKRHGRTSTTGESNFATPGICSHNKGAAAMVKNGRPPPPPQTLGSIRADS